MNIKKFISFILSVAIMFTTSNQVFAATKTPDKKNTISTEFVTQVAKATSNSSDFSNSEIQEAANIANTLLPYINLSNGNPYITNESNARRLVNSKDFDDFKAGLASLSSLSGNGSIFNYYSLRGESLNPNSSLTDINSDNPDFKVKITNSSIRITLNRFEVRILFTVGALAGVAGAIATLLNVRGHISAQSSAIAGVIGASLSAVCTIGSLFYDGKPVTIEIPLDVIKKHFEYVFISNGSTSRSVKIH